MQFFCKHLLPFRHILSRQIESKNTLLDTEIQKQNNGRNEGHFTAVLLQFGKGFQSFTSCPFCQRRKKNDGF